MSRNSPKAWASKTPRSCLDQQAFHILPDRRRDLRFPSEPGFSIWLWLKKPVPKWVTLLSGNMAKPAVCPSCLILSYTHFVSSPKNNQNRGPVEGDKQKRVPVELRGFRSGEIKHPR